MPSAAEVIAERHWVAVEKQQIDVYHSAPYCLRMGLVDKCVDRATGIVRQSRGRRLPAIECDVSAHLEAVPARVGVLTRSCGRAIPNIVGASIFKRPP